MAQRIVDPSKKISLLNIWIFFPFFQKENFQENPSKFFFKNSGLSFPSGWADSKILESIRFFILESILRFLALIKG